MSLHSIKPEKFTLLMWVSLKSRCPVCGGEGLTSHHVCARSLLGQYNVYYCVCLTCSGNYYGIYHYFVYKSDGDSMTCDDCRFGTSHPVPPSGVV